MTERRTSSDSNYLLQAVKLDPAAKKIQLNDGFELSYDKCLLATGGEPRNLPVFAKGSDDLKSRVSVYRRVSINLKWKLSHLASYIRVRVDNNNIMMML